MTRKKHFITNDGLSDHLACDVHRSIRVTRTDTRDGATVTCKACLTILRNKAVFDASQAFVMEGRNEDSPPHPRRISPVVVV